MDQTYLQTISAQGTGEYAAELESMLTSLYTYR